MPLPSAKFHLPEKPKAGELRLFSDFHKHVSELHSPGRPISDRGAGPIKTVMPDGDIVRRAIEARAEYGVHFYDGMIVAAAERAGCGKIWSEDLNAGRKSFGIAVENPFAA